MESGQDISKDVGGTDREYKRAEIVEALKGAVVDAGVADPQNASGFFNGIIRPARERLNKEIPGFSGKLRHNRSEVELLLAQIMTILEEDKYWKNKKLTTGVLVNNEHIQQAFDALYPPKSKT